MQPTRGITLRRFLDQHKQLTLGQALPILTQLAEALDYVEARGLVYQTLDPDDVILESENEPPSVTITSIGEVREDLNGQREVIPPPCFSIGGLESSRCYQGDQRPMASCLPACLVVILVPEHWLQNYSR